MGTRDDGSTHVGVKTLGPSNVVNELWSIVIFNGTNVLFKITIAGPAIMTPFFSAVRFACRARHVKKTPR